MGTAARLNRAARAAYGKAKQRSSTQYWACAAGALTYEDITERWLAVPEWLLSAVSAATKRSTKNLRRVYIDIFHDMVGNPFRPPTFDPAWRTSTAVAIAKGMYESRDFGAMPILADALQDAGCDSDDVLNHCRKPKQVHVRGCRVVELVLGKS